MNIVPMLERFYELFGVKLSKDNEYYLNPRTNRKVFQLPTSNHPVRSEFFLVRKTNQAAWEFPSVFQKMKTPTREWTRTEEGENFFESVREVVYQMTGEFIISTARLCSGEYMVRAGIS